MIKVHTSDGVGIVVHDWGGDGPPLLMAHATGFHGRVFAPLAGYLSKGFHCWSFDERGHGDSDRAPGGNYRWDGFRRDVVAVIDGIGLNRPYGLGHSCGATALMLAEEQHPGTLAGLCCFEPIIWPETVPAPPNPDNELSVAARRRRGTFESRQAAYDNYASKAPLNVLDPEVLRIYLEYGFADQADGQVGLKCRPGDEAAIYENGPANGAYAALGDIAIPTRVMAGSLTEPNTAWMAEAAAVRLGQGPVETIDGLGHFGPLQDPTRVAQSVLAAFSWNPSSP
ncbi:MAG: alpha/beta fold hydrolase [Acidimicrobiales bacterium]